MVDDSRIDDASLMIPTHDRWVEFYAKLAGTFPPHADAASTKATCDHTQKRATKVLGEMEGIDVVRSLAIYGRHEGRCDCEILIEFEDRWRADVLKVGPKAPLPRD